MQSNNSLVSVIVPCYNQSDFILDSLNSVLSQTYFNWECIIVNDGSTDDSEIKINNFIKKDYRFRSINIKNSGVSKARNIGISHAKGFYILPLDGDDTIHQRYIEKSVEMFSVNPQLTLVYCKAAFFGIKNELWNLPNYNFKNLLLYNHIFCSALFRKTDFLKTGGYDCSLIYGFEDWDLWLKLLDSESEVYQIDEILFYYRIKLESRSTIIDADKDKSRKARIRIYENNIEKYSSIYSDPISVCRDLNLTLNELTSIKESKVYRWYKSLNGLLPK